MRRSPLIPLLLLTTGVGVAAWFGINHHYRQAEENSSRARESELQAWQQAWDFRTQERLQALLEDSQKDLAAYEKDAANHLKQLRQKLEEALGGPVEMAARNPEYSLSTMIREVALACAPKNARAEVNVDRFTEFDLTVSLAGLETRLVLADCARCILGHGARYLNSIRFVYATDLLAQIDKREIEAVSDWRQVTTDNALAAIIASMKRHYALSVKENLDQSPAGPHNEASPAVEIDSFYYLLKNKPTAGDPFAEYDQQMLGRVNQLLARLMAPLNPAFYSTSAQAEFKVRQQADGRVVEVELVKSNAGANLNVIFNRAILDAGPYPPWNQAQRQSLGSNLRVLKMEVDGTAFRLSKSLFDPRISE